MTAGKLTLMLTALLAVIALSAWGAMTGNAAEGAPQTNPPAAARNDEDGEAKNDSEGSISPADAEKAKAAALKIAGGGTVQDVEMGDDGNPGWYEVEIRKADGSEVKVQLDASFNERAGGEESEGGDEQEGPNDDD